MNYKSCIAALFALFMLGVTTSCEDMFNIESNRVVLNHEINSTSDSVYSTLGVLQCMRKVADRYVILGEVRGDMAQIDDEVAKTSLRNLANFNFNDSEQSNEYLNVRDYYTIINNCNYALAKMNSELTFGGQGLLVDEYAALQGIRAWTYLQLAINYGDVFYYTDPVISEQDTAAIVSAGKKDIQFITEDLASKLIPCLDYELPSFVSTTGSYPILRLVLAELYLWSGDYANAKKYYEEYFMKNKKAALTMSDADGSVMQSGFVDLGGMFTSWNGVDLKDGVSSSNQKYTVAGAVKYSDDGDENLSQIPMETSSDKGLVSEVARLFATAELRPSAYWKSLSGKQAVFHVESDDKGNKTDIKTSVKIGDMRKYEYVSTGFVQSATAVDEKETIDLYTKHSYEKIVTQRRSIACLRWAEAMNALAKEQFEVAVDSASYAEARQNAIDAFYLLKDAFKVFFPEGSQVWTNFERFHDQLQTKFVGIHARGTGDVYYDSLYYVLTPNAIISRLGLSDSIVTFNDTVQYIDELLIDELALESTLEGNRFGDLIRFAKRREAWGDSEYRDFLASRVANRGGEETEAAVRDSLYNKLNDSEDYWYLPYK